MENTSTNTALVPASFPNGNSIAGPNVLLYTERYQTFLNQTAASILALTETVYEAKKNLTDDEFKEFRDEVGLKSKATLSKFLLIGENSTRLKEYSDRLPHAWTTLYRLAQLSDDQLATIEPSISPDMSATVLNKILNPSTASIAPVVKDLPDVKLYLDKLEFGQKKGFLKKLTELLRLYQVNFKVSGDFSIEVKKMRSSSAAYILQLPKGNVVTDDDKDIAA